MATKAEAKYSPHGSAQEHCAICAHYRPPGCSVVTGNVVPGGWCQFFKLTKATLPPLVRSTRKIVAEIMGKKHR